MAKLEALIERVRAATGPDRELDALIFCALLAPKGSKVDQSKFNGAWIVYEPASYGKEPFRIWEIPSPWRRWSIDGMPLTASVDAALALAERVLLGWQVAMGTCGEDDTPWACITEPDDPCRDFAVSSVTIPLAIVEAALLALQSNTGVSAARESLKVSP